MYYTRDLCNSKDAVLLPNIGSIAEPLNSISPVPACTCSLKDKTIFPFADAVLESFSGEVDSSIGASLSSMLELSAIEQNIC